MSEPIRFHRTDGLHGYLSNFAASEFTLDGSNWPTVEHYFQAMKFEGTAHQKRITEIRNAPTPRQAADMGRRTASLRDDWEDTKEDVMRRALWAKFEQNDDLRKRLLATGDTDLVEHTTRDSYWGDGGTGTGRNRLGHLLMEVRAMLREE